MTLLDQCKIWNENDEYQKIIEALEAVPAQERTPEMDSELARAYNNQAAPGDRELFRKAIALLKPHEAYFAGDHCWNFRMGYSYYYLDQEGRALPYFQAALEARPGDGVPRSSLNGVKRESLCPGSRSASGSGRRRHGRNLLSRRHSCVKGWMRTRTISGGMNWWPRWRMFCTWPLMTYPSKWALTARSTS